MRHVSLWLVREDAPAAALALAELGAFCPDLDADGGLDAPDAAERRFREAWLSARSRLERIGASCDTPPEAHVPPAPQPVGLDAMAALDARLGEIWNEAFAGAEAVRLAEEERARTVQLLGTLATFAGVDVDLGALLRERRFLAVRLGTVPAQNVARLRDALTLAGFVLDTFGEDASATRAIVVGPAGRETQIDSLLATAGWHGIEVPPDLRTHPDTARDVLQRRLAALDADIASRRAAARETLRRRGPDLDAAATTIAIARPYAEVIESALRGRGGLTQLSGWIPRRDEERLRTAVAAAVSRPHLLRLRDPEPGERARVPSVVRQPALLRGFAELVHTYGVPRYGEIDPTALFAVSFVIMFGMMFGDVGQGAVLAGAGLALRGRLASARTLMVSCGTASMVFGLLYGSVFGVEHWVHPVWISPLADPLRMLAVAVYWGIGFIAVASLVRIHNLWAAHGPWAAMADAGGAAGLTLYLGAVSGLASVLQGGEFGAAPALAMALGAAVILAHAYREQEGPVAERALVAFIETFEALIGFFANTLSFMRVGAFSLNHVALAAAVFAIAGMLSGAGQVAAIVAGNVFILVLEGAIVAIQALRLEYYEGFSRFFSGDGRSLTPLLLRTPPRHHHQTKGA